MKRAKFGEPARWLLRHAGHESSGCLIWPFSRTPSGRAKIRRGKSIVHAARVMCEIVHGPAPSPEHEAAHSCGKGHMACVHPQHVRWATKEENEADKLIHGTMVLGADHKRSKLTDDDVREIRALAAAHHTLENIGGRFAISSSNAGLIVQRKTWRHVL